LDSFDVVTLGTPGAGTSMFLAAMFGQLATAQPGSGFFLDVGLAQARMLQRIDREAIHPEDGWPGPAQQGGPAAWEFTCCVRSAGRIFEIFRINYLDFAGLRLPPGGTGGAQASRHFQQKISTAHALLGVLDGLLVRRLLDDRDTRPERLAHAGMKTIFQMMRAHAAGRPVHLIISKWDLLAGTYDLSDVRAKLMEFGDFAALVRGRGGRPGSRAGRGWDRPGRPKPLVRLIPVSAVGPGFAQPDPDGRISKPRTGTAGPVNAEIPLVALPIDFFQCVARPAARDPASLRARQALGRAARQLKAATAVPRRADAQGARPGRLSRGPQISDDLLRGLAGTLQPLRPEYGSRLQPVADSPLDLERSAEGEPARQAAAGSPVPGRPVAGRTEQPAAGDQPAAGRPAGGQPGRPPAGTSPVTTRSAGGRAVPEGAGHWALCETVADFRRRLQAFEERYPASLHD
jgi:hypothetical protein